MRVQFSDIVAAIFRNSDSFTSASGFKIIFLRDPLSKIFCTKKEKNKAVTFGVQKPSSAHMLL